MSRAASRPSSSSSAARPWRSCSRVSGRSRSSRARSSSELGVTRFDDVAYDTVAAIVNDLCCVGALPLVVNAYFATGSSDWYEDHERHAQLLEGWRAGCVDAGAAWGGGESPRFRASSRLGRSSWPGARSGRLPDGSPILGIGSLGGRRDRVHRVQRIARERLVIGAAWWRATGGRLPHPLPSGRSFGEALLDRSVIYTGS